RDVAGAPGEEMRVGPGRVEARDRHAFARGRAGVEHEPGLIAELPRAIRPEAQPGLAPPGAEDTAFERRQVTRAPGVEVMTGAGVVVLDDGGRRRRSDAR